MEHFLEGETESTPFQRYSLNKASGKCKTSIYVLTNIFHHPMKQVNDWALNRTLLPNLIALSMLYGHLSIKIDGAAEKIFAQKVKRPEEMIPSRVAARLVVYLLRNRYLVSALKIRAQKFNEAKQVNQSFKLIGNISGIENIYIFEKTC